MVETGMFIQKFTSQVFLKKHGQESNTSRWLECQSDNLPVPENFTKGSSLPREAGRHHSDSSQGSKVSTGPLW